MFYIRSNVMRNEYEIAKELLAQSIKVNTSVSNFYGVAYNTFMVGYVYKKQSKFQIR